MGAAAADQHQASMCVVKLGEPVLVPPAKPCKQESPYFLTNLDQNLAVVMQTVYFFKGLKHLQDKQQGDDDDDAAPNHNPHNSSESSPDPAQVIRKALAEVLVHYYPLAGRLSLSKEMKLEVVCEDQGALFVEADADMSIEEFTDDFKREMGPVSANLMQFIYSVPGARSILDIPLVVAQVTRFRCGGFVLGLCTNHALFDGISAMEFVNSWGEIARGVPLSVSPVLERSMLKARNPLQVQYPHPEFLDINDPSSISPPAADDDNSKLDFKSMGFSAEWLDSLKQSIVREGVHTKVSSFEAFSALVWKCRTIASSSNNQKQTKLLFAVDVRNRLEPPLPTGYFGNGILLTGALTSVQDLTQGSLSHIIELIRQAIHRTDDSYLRSLIDFYEQTRLRPSLSSTLVITTWSRLAFHTTDFGWGTPLYTAPASLPEPEVALLLPHGTARTGFEIVLGLPPAAMGRFVELMHTSWRSD